MGIFRNNIVEMVQNSDGVFEPATPEFDVSFDFNELIKPFARGGIINFRPVRPEERPPLKKIDLRIALSEIRI